MNYLEQILAPARAGEEQQRRQAAQERLELRLAVLGPEGLAEIQAHNALWLESRDAWRRAQAGREAA